MKNRLDYAVSSNFTMNSVRHGQEIGRLWYATAQCAKHFSREEQVDNNFKQSMGFEPPVSVGEWMLTMLICFIPVVNIVMLFVWAFGPNTNASKANWAKASLIWMLVGIVLSILFIGALMSLFLHLVR